MPTTDRIQLYAYLGDRCGNCGVSVAEMLARWDTVNRLFDFHHVDPAAKAPNYSNLIRRKISAKVLDEVDKCVLLCTLCHSILHAQAITGTLVSTLELEGRHCTQTLSGNYISDRKNNSMRFLTNELLLTIPYLVAPTAGPAQLVFGTEMSSKWVFNRLRGLQKHEEFTINDWKTDVVLLSAVKGNELISFEVDVRFPIIPFDLFGDSVSDSIAWIRNGMVVLKDGKVKREGTLNCKLTMDDVAAFAG